MIERIEINEKRLENIQSMIQKLEEALSSYKENQKDLKKLEKYYGSKNWFKDKKAYEQKQIKPIKAGVLSEDEVWNTLEELNELRKKMKNIEKYKKL